MSYFRNMTVPLFVISLFYLTFLSTTVLSQSFEKSRCRCICPDPNAMEETKNISLPDRRVYVKNVKAKDCHCNTVVLTSFKEKLPDLSDDVGNKFCLRCECKFESRDTTLIQVVIAVILTVVIGIIFYMIWLYCLKLFVRGSRRSAFKAGVYQRQMDDADTHVSDRSSEVVVSLVICIISLLVVYMGFLLCLDPMMKQPRRDHPYERHQDDEDNIFAAPRPVSEGSLPSSSMEYAEARQRRSGEGVLGRVEAQQNKWFKKVHEQRRKIFTDHTMLN